MDYVIVAVSPFYNGRGWTDQATGVDFKQSNHLRKIRIKKDKDLSGIKNSVRLNNLLLLEGDLSDTPERATKVNPEELTKEQFRAMIDILQGEASDDETVDRLRQERDDAIDNAEALESQLSSKDLEISNLTSENNSLSSQVSTLTSNNNSLSSQVDTLNSTVSGLESGKTVLEGQVADLESENADLELDKAGLQTQVDDLESDNAILQSQVDDLQAQLDAIGDEGAEAGVQAMSLDEDSLSDKTKAELKEIADEKGIDYTTSDTKQELVDKIEAES